MGKTTVVSKKQAGKKAIEKKEYTIKYRSHTDKTKWYKISVTDDDITCTCPDFVYRKQKKKLFCKHIFEALK
jgi:hypothetical protein